MVVVQQMEIFLEDVLPDCGGLVLNEDCFQCSVGREAEDKTNHQGSMTKDIRPREGHWQDVSFDDSCQTETEQTDITR